ncbi:MAG: histidine phosphatase family protein [Bacteroides sp.]|nr:histidine phosphatase family protein [Eubacterium sp.]MCM1418628.1 histidine phosphatase family protein [Roseburia sp.]MCM1462682.1 histidine phosphatase family protein [Bacteroides sp.]
MKILIIRHGDPDYTVDSLTEKGRVEAALLAERIAPLSVKDYYVSPLGRARDTAEATLKKAGRTAETLPWLKEFNVDVTDPVTGEVRGLPWDFPPEEWTVVPEYYDKSLWYDVPYMRSGNMRERLAEVWDGLDMIFERHGYRREGNLYRAVRLNEDRIVFFCHFGVQCVMLGHLLGISPMILWHGLITAPTAVTTLCSEERREGAAFFRASAIGDISHLYSRGEEPAFAGRFCEMFSNANQRHD